MRFFPERQVYFRTNGEVRFISLSRRVQIAASLVCLSMIVWFSVATYSYVYRAEILTAKDRELAATEKKYIQSNDQFDKLKNDIEKSAKTLEQRQIYLQQLLGYPLPAYLHIPVAVSADNEKLSKQTHAQAVEPRDWLAILCDVLAFLNQPLPESVEDANQADFWQWAIEHWNSGSLPATRSIRAAPAYAG